LISGPLSGKLSDRYGARGFATAGTVIFGGSFIGLMLIPVDFSYSSFALLTFANGIGSGMFSAPNTSSLMSAVPASQRGAASGMRATFQNSGTALSIGAFFSVMIAGLAGSLAYSLTSGLQHQGVGHAVAARIGSLPPVSSLFAATLGVNPLQHLLAANDALSALSSSARKVVTGRAFFPHLISSPFHQGLVIVFALAAGLAALAGVASLLRGKHDAASTGPPTTNTVD
jgi:MFS family permease